MRTRAAAFVGRRGELGVLDEIVAGARRGRGGAAFITGEPGIGKSRLMLEVLGHALDAEVAVLHGRGSSTGPAVPFRALTEALMAAARTVGPDIPAQLGPYRPVLGRLVPEWADPGSGVGEASVLVLGEAILRLTALIGRGRGCVLALDDLHEADPETLAVVEYVAGNLSGLPVAVLVTMRTEAPAASAFADAVCSRGDAEPVTLSRLDTEGVRELMLSCLDSEAGVPDVVVERLLSDSAGNPFVIEELLHSMVSSGELVHGHEGWRLDRMPVSTVPPNLVRVIGARAERLGAEAARLLSVAAVLGRRFPLSVVQSVLGLDDSVLMDHVQSASDAQLLCPDDVLLGWYAFQHPLTADALCRRLSPDDTTTLSRQAAKVIADTRPDLPDEWLHLAIRLRTQADDPVGAVRLYLESARRALAAGASGSAIAVLDEARAVLGEPGQAADRRMVLAELLEALLFALAEAGQFDRALEVADQLTFVSVGGDGERRIGLHLRLAWAAQVAGRWAEGDAQVAAVRALAGVATEEQLASLDAVDAYLAVQGPAADRVDRCRRLARSAVDRAESAGLPSIACQAWYAVGFSTRDVDLAESDASFRRVLDIATEHDLVTWRNYALVGLGSNAWLGEGDRGPLQKAHEEALRTGTISLAHNAAAVLGLTAVLHGDFDHASAHLDTCIAETKRMKLVIVTRYSLMAKAVLAAHRGRRDEMSAALLEFGEHGGEGSEAAPLAHGLGRGFGALLQEDRAAAELEMAAVAAEESRRQNPFHLAGSYGLALLLDVLAGRADQRRWQEVSATSVSGMRWNRHFVALAGAVLAGRSGDTAAASDWMRRAAEAGSVFPTAQHLGLRLVAEAALSDGWGSPNQWLRDAEEYFFQRQVIAVAGACRTLLRRIGEPVRQRRAGTSRIPDHLRRLGVTSREFEVLELLPGRLSNKALAARLHISPRTVEKHVASLMVKTGAVDRDGLFDRAAELLS